VPRVRAGVRIIAGQDHVSLLIDGLDSFDHFELRSIWPARNNHVANLEWSRWVDRHRRDQRALTQKRSHALTLDTQRVD
jgi:hypothetical protein